MKTPRPVENLHAKIHGIDYENFLSSELQFGGIVEFAFAGAWLPDRSKHLALHIHDVNLVAQGVGDVNALLRRIHCDSRGTFEKSFPAFQGADHAPEFSARIKHENLPRHRIGHINIVLRIHRDALRRHHGIFAAVFARQKLIFLFGEIENVDPVRTRISHDHASARISRNAVGIYQEMKIRLARNHVNHASPKAALRLDFALQAEASLESQLAAAIEQQLWWHRLARRLRLTGGQDWRCQ